MNQASIHTNNSSTGTFSLIRGGELLEKYGSLFKKLEDYGFYYNDSDLLLVCEGDAVVEGNIDLNFAAGWGCNRTEKHAALLARFGLKPPANSEDIMGMAVMGNLCINGGLTDSAEMSAYFYVDGKLFANHVYADNAFIHIRGDAEIEDNVTAVYNGGVLIFENRLTVPVFKNFDKHCTIVGDPDITLFAYDSYEEADNSLPDVLKSIAKDDVKDAYGVGADVLDPAKVTPEKLAALKEFMSERRNRLRKSK